ncbi:transcriptional regulator SlyA [Zobellella endophytica]|uniref:Transcriptional regulator SlyA n=1 Tax=Zobellella endophytica TaxID=2116700 RepID=A0A2P7R4Q6_9GAMM|nr:transcriptional regulator SlyA [Zobellella endophytica]PSJ45181.1 transcriptional regulator SlyA [Zobellella endophytica]
MKTLGMALASLVRQWRAVNDERLKPLGLTQSRWITLSHLKQEDGVLQHQLARSVGVENPSMVRTLDGLERQGLIERRPCSEDRRAKRVHLTAAARPLLAQMELILDDSRRQILAGLSEEQLGVFCQVMEQIHDNLQGMSGPKE